MSNLVKGSDGVDATDKLVGSQQTEPFADPRDANLLNKSRAEAAYDEEGLTGAVGVSQDILRDIIEDLTALADGGDVRSSDVQFHVSTLREVDEMLLAATQQELNNLSDENPSVSEQQPSAREEETEAKPSDSSTNSENPADKHEVDRGGLIEATIDRISGSGNVLATSPDLSAEHIHVTHGTVGNQVVVLKPADGWSGVKGGDDRARVLPYSDIENALEAFSTDEKLQLEPGNSIKVEVEEVDSDKGIAPLSEFENASRVKAFGKPSKKGDQLTVEIKKVEGDTAQGYVVKRTSKTKRRKTRSRKRSKKKRKHKSSKRDWRKGQGIKRSPIAGSNNKNMNDLLNGKL